MKKLVITALLMQFSAIAFADVPDVRTDVVKAFYESKDVADKILVSVRLDRDIAKQPDVALLSGSCGTAGCTRNYLVTLAVATKGVNPQTGVIAAIVKDEFNAFEAKLVSVEPLLNQAHQRPKQEE
ncbi:MAG: hypothetical protein C5B49_04450 [Bdellovibrio sp.]|nr:MAG: hypothetical protein C5B49_04450 [Bdellovibrio sp.]